MKQTVYRVKARVRPDGRLELNVPFPGGTPVEVQVIALGEPEEVETVAPVRGSPRGRREDVLDVVDDEEIIDESSPILRAVYTLFIVLSVGLAFYLYVVAFDRLSETMLVTLSPMWVLPLVFGLYGFVSQHLILLIRQGKAHTVAEAARVWTAPLGAYAFAALALLLPFLLLQKWRYSLPVAVLATLFWAVLLVLFFAAIFPML